MGCNDDEKIAGLVTLAKEGDRPAFSEIVRLLMKPIVALTYRMTRDHDLARDLAQETFVTAWEKIGTFRGDARFESWLYRIAYNKTLNQLDKVRREVSPDAIGDQPAGDVASNPEASLYQSDLQTDILAFAAQLPPQQRIVFDLRFYKGMSFGEVADATEKAEGTVKTHYRQAVEKLRHFARERGWR